jgi:hypothetical protein
MFPLASPLPLHAEHNVLVATLEARCNPLVPVHIVYLSAYKRLVNLYGSITATNLAIGVSHCGTDAMKHEASRLLCDTNRAVNLIGGTPFLKLAGIHIAIIHLSSPIGESSKMVPIFKANYFLQPLQGQILRVFTNEFFADPQRGKETTPFAQRSSTAD